MEKISNFIVEQTQHAKEFIGLAKYEKIPEIEEAKKRLQIIEERFNFLSEQISAIFNLIPNMINTTNEISECLVEADRKNGLKAKTIVNTIKLFYETIGEDASNILIKQYEDSVVVTLKEQRETIDTLKEMRQNRHKLRLTVASYKDKVEVLSKIGDPKLLTSTRIQLHEKEQELDKISKKFVRCVNRLWDHRNDLIEQPMEELIGIVFNFCKGIYTPLQMLMTAVSPEELQKDYFSEISQKHSIQ